MLLLALLNTFALNLLPILLLSGAGFALGRTLHIEPRPLGQVIFYLLSPILVFNLLWNNRLSWGEVAQIALYAALLCLILGVSAALVSSRSRLPRTTRLGMILTAAFGNTGNYGLPLVAFAFGKEALAYATVYFVTNSILFNTVGVLVASLGHLDIHQAGRNLLRIPTIYAVPLALGLSSLHITLPEALRRTLDLGANAAIPLMLVLLGLELGKVTWGDHHQAILSSTALRLLISPLLSGLLAIPFGFQGKALQAVLAEASMPAAITTTVLASEYRLDTSTVTAIVFLSTLLSPLTLTPLIFFLQKHG